MSTTRMAFRVAAAYAVAAVLWIVGIDLATGGGGEASELRSDILTQLGFVALTTVVLFVWIRREAWRRVRESERYQAVAESAPDMVYRLRLHPEPVFEYVSPASEDVNGYTPEEFYAQPEALLNTVHTDDRDQLLHLLANPDDVGEGVELRWIHKDGRVVWTENRIKPVRNEEGVIVAVYGIARNITGRKSQEKRNRLLATAVDAAGEAVIVTGPDGRIEYVNPAFTAITGYVLDEVAGKTPGVLSSGRHDGAFYEGLWATITAGRTFRGEMVNRRKDGRFYDQECTINPVLDENGRVTHFVSVARDVTVEREMSEQLRLAQRMEAVGQMAAGIAHDFRNLLNVIGINATLLAESGHEPMLSEVPTPGAKGSIREIQEATTRGTQLVGKLLTLGRRDRIDLVLLDPGAVAEGMLSTFRAVLSESIHLTTRIADDLPPIRADRGSVEQILLNLVANARDALGGKGEVALELESVTGIPATSPSQGDVTPRGPFVRMVVRDSGEGMTPEVLRQIFEPYYTTKPEGHGTGLGLATTRSLMERHGGLINVRSQPGEGTTFELYFPSQLSEPPDRADDASSAASVETLPGGTEKILLVEDEEALRRAGIRVLEKLGYEVVPASDGAEGLEILSRSDAEIDLVITDLVMPRMGGRDLFERSRALGLNVPFLFVSGYGPEEWDWRPNPDRRWLILEKPWSMMSLAHQVREVLDRGTGMRPGTDYRAAGTS